MDRRHLGGGRRADRSLAANPIPRVTQQPNPGLRRDRGGGALRLRYRLRRLTLPAVVRNADVPAPDAAHGAADRDRRAAVSVFLVSWAARFDDRAWRHVLPHQPALRGVDDKKLYRRGTARGRAGGRNPRRISLANRVRGRPAADSLGAGRHVYVYPDPKLE